MTTTPIHTVTSQDAKLTISPMHLSVDREWGGGSNNIHLLENGDLGVILSRGDSTGSQRVPHEDSLVVIAIGVDDDHDEVHYTHRNAVDTEELLLEAIESLIACHAAIRRIRMAGDAAGERNAFELGRDFERGQQSS